jgi:hypothetical protein
LSALLFGVNRFLQWHEQSNGAFKEKDLLCFELSN